MRGPLPSLTTERTEQDPSKKSRPIKSDHRYTRRGLPWSAAELKQLGKTPDSVLARRNHRTISEVVAMRTEYRLKVPQKRLSTQR
jgi:hypothetical protein